MAKYFIQVMENRMYEKEIEANSKEEAEALAYEGIYEDDFDGFSFVERFLNVYVDEER